MIYVFALAGLLLHIIGTRELSVKAGSIQSLYKGYNNLPCVLYSLGIFVLLRDVAQWIQKSKKAVSLVNFLGKYTFPYIFNSLVYITNKREHYSGRYKKHYIQVICTVSHIWDCHLYYLGAEKDTRRKKNRTINERICYAFNYYPCP